MRAFRSLILCLVLVLTGCGVAAPSTPSSGGSFTVTDVTGRTVTFDKRPTRIALSESRQAYSLAFLQRDDITRNVVAWGNDMARAAPDVWKQLTTFHPKAKDVPTIGSVYSNDLSVEGLLAHKPDVFVMTLDAYEAAKKNGFADKLEQAKLPVVVTDFRLNPLKNTTVSVELLGKLFNAEAKAAEFTTFYRSIVDPIVAKAKTATSKPTAFLWRAPSIAPCCSTYANANFGSMLTAVGATNIADTLLPGQEGALTPEQVLASQPHLIVATGGEWGAMKAKDDKVAYLHLGYGVSETDARASLAALKSQTGFDQLQAFNNNHVYGIYHQFYDSPYNFVALASFARWTQPELFSDVNPTASWQEFHTRFMPWQAQGTFFVGL